MIRLAKVSKVFSKGKPGRTPGSGAAAGEVHALRDVTLDVAEGEIFGVIGRSGAGKSTLIRVINLLERPTAGRVFVGGRDLTALPEPALRRERRHIGMIFQHFNLLSSRTAFGNIALPLELAGTSRREIEAAVEPLLDLVGLTDKRDRYPAELSGGQKQRVGIARALANRPNVVLCDEATSALDPETTKSILRLLADINRRLNLTIVLITHEMSVIKEICQRVAVLEDGAVIEQGSVFEIFTRPQAAVTRAFVGSLLGAEIPDEVRGQIGDHAAPGGAAVLRVTLTGEHATEPVISQLSRRLGIDVNILHGRVDRIQGEPFGSLVVSVSGGPEKVQAAVTYLSNRNLAVEPLGHVAANLRAVG